VGSKRNDVAGCAVCCIGRGWIVGDGGMLLRGFFLLVLVLVAGCFVVMSSGFGWWDGGNVYGGMLFGSVSSTSDGVFFFFSFLFFPFQLEWNPGFD
jgi:hypothetical protein